MSTCSITNFGGKFYISTTAANTDLDLSGFEALTYVEVPNLVTAGNTGIQQNIVTDSTWGNPVICKGKGEANAGDPTVEFQDIESAGKDAIEAAALFSNASNYAFYFEWSDGSKEYNRGLVTGPERTKGGNEDFKHLIFSLGFQQAPVLVAAST